MSAVSRYPEAYGTLRYSAGHALRRIDGMRRSKWLSEDDRDWLASIADDLREGLARADAMVDPEERPAAHRTHQQRESEA